MLGCIGVVQYNLEILDLVCLNGGFFFFLLCFIGPCHEFFRCEVVVLNCGASSLRMPVALLLCGLFRLLDYLIREIPNFPSLFPGK